MSLTDDDKRWIRELMEGMETRLLTAFHDWASPMDARVRSHAAVLRALDVGYDELRDRVKKLEDRK